MKKYFCYIILYLLLNNNSVFAGIFSFSERMNILPNGRCTGSVLENIMDDTVFFGAETGGFSRADLPRFSSKGISWIEQNFSINGIDVTDPFRSGFPLLEPPWDSISGIDVRSSGEFDPNLIGLVWSLDMPLTGYSYSLKNNNTFPAFRGSLIPEGVMDREPSFSFGSPHERRRQRAHELSGSYNNGKLLILTENYLAERKFPTLIDENGNHIEEKSGKYTLVCLYNNPGRIPFNIIFISQYSQNNNFGSDLRLSEENTFSQRFSANHLQLNMEKKISSGILGLNSGITAKFEERNSHLISPAIIVIADESGPIPEAGAINRINFDNNFVYETGILKMDAGFQANTVIFKPDIPFLQTNNTYNNTVYSVTLWDNPETCREMLFSSAIKAELEETWNRFTVSGNVYLDNSSSYANGENLISWWGIGGKLSSMIKFDSIQTALFFGALHQPAKMNSGITGFLNTHRPSGKVYTGWTDQNDNAVVDGNEQAGMTLFSTTGGIYHNKDDLKRPYQDELFFGIEKDISDNITIGLNGSHRIFSDYFIVNYGSYDGAYTQTVDGYPIYSKPPGTDEYCLSNYAGDPAHYTGAEIIASYNSANIFLDVSFAAFMVRGFAPAGNGPDNNDYAVISEESASPNSRINSADGRMSGDRAYMAKALFGWIIFDDLTFGMTIKYRDGEPFTQYRFYSDANGMPVMIMNQKRGNWYDSDFGRYTFAWNIDMRLRYTPQISSAEISLILDVYNVLGSATELLESNKFDDNRKAIEAVPRRMAALGVEIHF